MCCLQLQSVMDNSQLESFIHQWSKWTKVAVIWSWMFVSLIAIFYYSYVYRILVNVNLCFVYRLLTKENCRAHTALWCIPQVKNLPRCISGSTWLKTVVYNYSKVFKGEFVCNHKVTSSDIIKMLQPNPNAVSMNENVKCVWEYLMTFLNGATEKDTVMYYLNISY